MHRPNLTVTYSGSDLAVAALAAAVVAAWAAVAGGAFSLLALVACEVAFLAFYLVGSLFAAWGPLAAGALFDLPLRLLMGYAAVNTALLVLAWVSPLGIVANFGLLFAGAAALFVAARPIRQRPDGGRRRSPGRRTLAGGRHALVPGLAPPDVGRREHGRLQAVDRRLLSRGPPANLRRRARGVHHRGLPDGRRARAPLPLRRVHDARLHQAGLGNPIRTRPSPASWRRMGVFFTGLGAYALVGSFWGSWPGLAAAAALLLLPDGAQQGMQNTFMSYHWLTQISPSASYGLALLALAWLFVLLGCTRGSRLQLVTGWLIAGVLAVYKLHFFIASALLLLLVPALFFSPGSARGPLGAGKRALWALAAAAVYAVSIVIVQRVPGVPTIRFDGSSVREIFALIKQFAPRGGLRDFLDGRLGPEHSLLSNLTVGVPYVLLVALGLFAPLLVILAIRLRKRTSPCWCCFRCCWSPTSWRCSWAWPSIFGAARPTSSRIARS